MYSTGSYTQFRQQPRYHKPKAGGNEDIKCDVCNISVRGQDQFGLHLTGAKHARKVKEQENTKKIGDVPHLRFDEYYGAYECTICKVSLNSSSVAMFHVVGSRHQESLRAVNSGETSEGGVAAPDTTERSSGSCATERAETEQCDQPSTQSVPGPSANLGLPTEFGSTKVAPSASNANPVRPNFGRSANMSPHLGPNFKYQCKPLASSFVSKYTLHTVEASVSTGMNAAPRPRIPSNGPKGQTFPCLACKISTNSEQQLQAHLASEKHKNRLGNSTGGPNGRQPNVPPPPLAMLALRCESCNISVNSQIQLDQHLQSPKHRNKLKMRYQPY